MNALRIARVIMGGSVAGGYRRLGYLIVTVAVAAGAWLALSTMAVVVLNGSAGGQVKFPGIHIANAGPGFSLPLAYMRRIEKLPDTRDVNWQTLVVFTCAPTARAVFYAVGGPGASTRVMYETARHKHAIDQATLARWQADPTGVLISRDMASDCGWHAGQSVEPPSLAGGKHVSMHIVGVLQAPSLQVGFAHYEYINRIGAGIMAGKNMVTFAQARARSVRDNERLAARIVAAFAHDSPTVKATTDVTVQNAVARFGKVQQLLAFVMAAVLLCAASILVSVLAHSATQRRLRFALLQVLGFGRGTLFAAVVIETALIIVIGAALGVGLGLWMAHIIGTVTPLGHLFTGYDFTPPPWAYRWMVPWLAALLVAALIAPALVIRRSHPADRRGG